jgi:sulfide:quinone oxidoreductase
VTGRFPGRIGLPLLRESRLNHLGKLAFQWFYWHMLLPRRDIPGMGPGMPLAGKRLEATHPPAASPQARSAATRGRG